MAADDRLLAVRTTGAHRRDQRDVRPEPRGAALWRIMQTSTHDHICDLFESDRVRMHFARVAGENLVSPDEKATAIGIYVFLGFLEGYGFGVARGGSGQLTDALIACIHGARRRSASPTPRSRAST